MATRPHHFIRATINDVIAKTTKITATTTTTRTFTSTSSILNFTTAEEREGKESSEENNSAGPNERIFFKEQEIVDGFKVFDPFMNKKRPGQEAGVPGGGNRGVRRAYVKNERDIRARSNRMSTDQDWTNVWPNAQMFKQSVVPLAVRQGAVRNMSENGGLAPNKYGNTELMKIPNFLHLTPPHVKKHCAAIKKFCTAWPKELAEDDDCERHFPVEITTSNYVYDGPSIRDDRARVATLRIKIDSLGLDDHARTKLIHLATPERYNAKTNVLTLVADRCPYRAQNEEYALYLLTTLYFESQQTEDWELSDITEQDRLTYSWENSQSKSNVLNAVQRLKGEEGEGKEGRDENNVDEAINEYKAKLTRCFDDGENNKNIDDFKKSVLDLLGLKNGKKAASSTSS